MNRWWGSAEDSDKQAGDRNSRAARRTIRRQTVVSSSDDEEHFFNANESISIPNLDGADDETVDEASTSAIMAPTPEEAELARQRALPVDQADFDNDADSWKKEIKLKFNINDVTYWFNSVEADMKKFGINKQWDKKDSIVPLLPDSIVEECMPILRLTQDEAGDTVYKDLKDEIISLYGPKEEDAFQKAMALKMTGTPSSFGKKLTHILCPGAKPFTTCHCARIVYGIWVAQLGPSIKSHLAGLKFNKDTYQDLFKKADEVFHANGGARAPAVVAAVSSPSPSSSLSSQSQSSQSAQSSADTPQVAAFQRGGGRGRGGRGRGRGRGGSTNNQNNSNQNQSRQENSSNSSQNQQGQKAHQKGQKHPDLPASAGWACAQHWKKGKGAPYCSDPLVCQWVNVVAPRT